MHTWKKEHGSAPMPRGKDVGDEWKALYSDQCDGAIKGGGWSQEGIKGFNELIILVEAIRAEDAGHKWRRHRYALSAIRKFKGIAGANKGENKKLKRKKKRGPVTPPKKIAIVRVQNIACDSGDETESEDDGNQKPAAKTIVDQESNHGQPESPPKEVEVKESSEEESEETSSSETGDDEDGDGVAVNSE